MVRKLVIIGGSVAAVGLVAVAMLAWWGYTVMTGPTYDPGSLAGGRAIRPFDADGSRSPWRVERDIEIHHVARGRGCPVLFVHGGPGIPVRDPVPWLVELEGSFEVHYYDQRGCGRSTRPFDRFESTNTWANMTALESTLGLQAQITDIERIRRLLGDEPVLVIGHSFGAFIAALYAAEFPDAVEALVLIAPADMLVMPSPDGDFLARVGETLPRDVRTEYDRFLESYLDFGSLFSHDEASLARMNITLGNYILGAMDRFPLPVPSDGAPTDVGGWMVHAMYLSMGKRHDYAAALSSITARTLVVHGARDLQPLDVSRRYVEGIAGARLLEIADAAHFFDGDHAALVGAVSELFGDGDG